MLNIRSKAKQGLIFTLLAALSSCVHVEPAPLTLPKIAVGQVLELVIPAPSLAGNLLSDRDEQPISVYLPPSYEIDSSRNYPVIYLLHGFTGTNRTWLISPEGAKKLGSRIDGDYEQAGLLTRENLDAAMTSNHLAPMIIVAPNGRNAYKHSFFINSSATGNWEDFIAEDVVSYIDENFRTQASAESRGIAGHSGGGNGALNLAMKRSDVFGTVYAMAPCCLGSMFSLPALEGSLTEQPNEFWQNVFSRIAQIESLDQLPASFSGQAEDFWVNAEFAAAAAYAPNPERQPFYADYLYEQKDGKWVANADAIKKRNEKSVFHLLTKYSEALKGLDGILIDYGEHEMDSLARGNAEFAKALAEQRVPFTMELYAHGDHGNLIAPRFLTRGLRFFSDTLKVPE